MSEKPTLPAEIVAPDDLGKVGFVHVIHEHIHEHKLTARTEYGPEAVAIEKEITRQARQGTLQAQQKTKQEKQATKRVARQTRRDIRQAKETTKQVRLHHWAAGFCVACAAVVMIWQPQNGWPVAMMLGGVGGVAESLPLVEKLKAKFSKSKEGDGA